MTEWLLISVDEKMAKRQGIPQQVPVPKEEFEGLAEKGMQMDQLKKWISGFLSAAPTKWRVENGATAKRYDAFIGKVDLWNRAQEAFKKRDYKAAISTLKMIGNIDPDDHAAKMNLGSALAGQGDLAGALERFLAVRDTFTGEGEYHVALGHVYMGLERKEDAIGEMVMALEAKPDSKEAMDALRALGVLVSLYEDPKDAASLTYVRADSVLEYMKGVWDAAPRDAAYFLEQASYHQSERRWDVALEAARRAGDASDRAVCLEIACLRALGQGDQALARAEARLATAKTADLLVELSRCLAEGGKAAAAKDALDEALALDPGNLMAIDLRLWPDDNRDLEKVQAVLPTLAEYAAKHPNVAGATRSLARAKLVIGNVDEALALFQRAVELAPQDDDLRGEWWGELIKLRKLDEVIADAQKLGDMSAHDWKLRWNEAEAYAAAGRPMEARACFAGINRDESLHVDVRKRARRAATELAGPGGA